MAQGLSNKRIAIALSISHATAKNHVHHILGKLQLHNRTAVAAYLRGTPSLVQPASQPKGQTKGTVD